MSETQFTTSSVLDDDVEPGEAQDIATRGAQALIGLATILTVVTRSLQGDDASCVKMWPHFGGVATAAEKLARGLLPEWNGEQVKALSEDLALVAAKPVPHPFSLCAALNNLGATLEKAGKLMEGRS